MSTGSFKNVINKMFTNPIYLIYIYKEVLATQVQFLDETDYISHGTNTLGKGMNPIILPPAMGK